MSFAFNAAPFNQSSNDTNIIQNKREANQRHNRTIKKKDTFSQVDSLIQKLHNSTSDDDIANFTPISPPHSESISKTIDKENSFIEKNENMNKTYTDINQPRIMNTDMNINKNKNMNTNVYEAFSQKGLNNSASDYSQQSLPTYYNKMSEDTGGNKELLEKLNYMIHLLEDQQEEKTGHVTEEIILYSFLGVFLIFIIDSFARAGKYVR